MCRMLTTGVLLWLATVVSITVQAADQEKPGSTPQAADTAKTREIRALEGNWKLAAFVDDGVALPSDKIPRITLVIQPDGTAKGNMPEGAFQATLRPDPGKTPKTLDINHTGGLYEGKPQYAIYKLEGDRLTLASTPPGGKEADRPRDLTKGRSLVFERTKAEKR